MIYIKKTFPSGDVKIYKGVPGRWYGRWRSGPRLWDVLPERPYPNIIRSLDEAAENGRAIQVCRDGAVCVYSVITQEEAAMIFFSSLRAPSLH